jgi:hypothetical protein
MVQIILAFGFRLPILPAKLVLLNNVPVWLVVAILLAIIASRVGWMVWNSKRKKDINK